MSIPVQICSATNSCATIAFQQIYEPAGQRIKYEKVAPGVGPVDVDKIVNGFEYEKGEYVLLDEKEIEGVKLESKKTLKLTQFVDSRDIDPIYFEKPCYAVAADDLAEEAFVVLREALRRTPAGSAPSRELERPSPSIASDWSKRRAGPLGVRRGGYLGSPAGLFDIDSTLVDSNEASREERAWAHRKE